MPAEDPYHRMVPFVAGVFINRLVRSSQRDHDRPWPNPIRRIIDRDCPVHDIGRDSRVPFDYPQVLSRRTAELTLRREIGSLDDERIALEMPARDAIPLPQRVAHRRSLVESERYNL